MIDAPPAFPSLGADAYVVVPEHLVNSAYSRAMTGSTRRVGYRDLEDFFTRIAAIVRAGGGRRFVYGYWPELDTLAHIHGVGSAPVATHLHALDRGFQALLDQLGGTDTLVLVVADHGFVDTRPESVIHLDRHPDLHACLSLPLCGEPRAAYCYVRPACVQRFERYVTEELRDQCELFPAAALVEGGWFGLGTPSPRLLERVGDYVLLMKGDRVIKDRLPGEAVFHQIGVHGGVSRAELYVPLVMARV
ncbi:MAG: alkaline phosphatase family protein [Gammaproteobacteria bacterium]